jgi:RNA polymerase sigma-70 factor (ECF subfamily)
MTICQDAALRDLLIRTGLRDEDALGDLQIRTRGWLLRCIRNIVPDTGHAEEVLQDVYTYVWLHAAEFRGERGAPLAWMGMLARSRAIDSYRRARREGVVVEFDDQVGIRHSSDSGQDAMEVWRNAQIRTEVRQLPASLRQLVDMAFFDGFSHSEIAARTGLPLGTVKTRIRSALAQLRAKLEDRTCLSRAA